MHFLRTRLWKYDRHSNCPMIDLQYGTSVFTIFYSLCMFRVFNACTVLLTRGYARHLQPSRARLSSPTASPHPGYIAIFRYPTYSAYSTVSTSTVRAVAISRRPPVDAKPHNSLITYYFKTPSLYSPSIEPLQCLLLYCYDYIPTIYIL
jgi:hypothetical protein